MPDLRQYLNVVVIILFLGDFRMSFGEDRNKVKNIVRPQIERFRELYASFWPGLAAFADFNSSTGRCEQDTSPGARIFHLNLLPKKIQVKKKTCNIFMHTLFLKVVLVKEKTLPTSSLHICGPNIKGPTLKILYDVKL